MPRQVLLQHASALNGAFRINSADPPFSVSDQTRCDRVTAPFRPSMTHGTVSRGDRACDVVAQVLYLHIRVCRIGYAAQYNGELITADTRVYIGGACRFPQRLRHRVYQRVSAVMTVGIITALEVVDVYHQRRVKLLALNALIASERPRRLKSQSIASSQQVNAATRKSCESISRHSGSLSMTSTVDASSASVLPLQ